jgi:protein involved in polysaccharide export with SLBB domain
MTKMKKTKRLSQCWVMVMGMLWAGLLLTGCQTGAPVFADFPGAPKGRAVGDASDVFRVGDWVAVAYSGTDAQIPTHVEAVKEDGAITPPLIGTVVAGGKTAGDLQKEIQEKYNKLYRNLTVTVLSQQRFYYVSGEVRSPGPKPYLGETDIVKAISAASDFTDFANKRKVRLISADGHTKIVNVRKAIEDPQYHVPVFPGDKIIVPRRFF